MPNMKLGVSGAEVTLPVLSKLGGVPTANVNESKQVQEVTMSDGSRRVGMLLTKRSWERSWDALTLAQLNVFQALNALSVPLRFQDEHEGSTWYNVYISSFTWSADLSVSGTDGQYYSVTLSIREL